MALSFKDENLFSHPPKISITRLEKLLHKSQVISYTSGYVKFILNLPNHAYSHSPNEEK